MKHPFERIRRICREVAASASLVHINSDYIPAYAASLPLQMATSAELDPRCHYLGKEEKTVAFLLTLDTINFGSGYFPHLRKRPGMSGYFNDLDQLTIFADNLVPHVLRMDGVLIYEESLIDRIAAGTLIPAGSAEEVEIRACALHAVELIKKEILKSKRIITSSELDYLLWNRGQQPHYKAVPRHRTRCVFY